MANSVMEMGDTENVVTTNLASSVDLSSSMLEKLGKAFMELETCKVAPSNHVPWNSVEAHFRNLESLMKKKLEELEVKQKEFTEKESLNRMLLAETEAAVVAEEQDLLDRVQELKDAAVATIIKARAEHVPELANGNDANGKKVSSSVDDENPLLDTQEGNSLQGENVGGLAFEVDPHAELTHFCERMDSLGLLKFVVENLKYVSSFWKEKLIIALGSATEPARLVLVALEGFFSPTELTKEEGDNRDASSVGMRQSCLILMEALSAFLSKAEYATDHFLNSETQQQAKSMANVWKDKLTRDSSTAANGKSLEAEGFLWLLATFRVASEFDDEELCRYVLAVAHHRQATELCHSLNLTQKIPGLVGTLIQSGRIIDAVHFIHAFQLSESFPPVTLLKTFLKDLRRNSQGNGNAALQNSYNARELEALRAVIGCVEEYNLEAEYPLDPLRKRVAQLDKSAKSDPKRSAEPSIQQQPQKKPRFDGGSHGSRARGRGSGGARHGRGRASFNERATYTGLSERYVPAVPSPYSYPVHTQSLNTAQVNAQRLSYYPQDYRPTGPYSPALPAYGSYLQPPHQPFPQ